jgi:hypothetical protein
VPFSEIPKRSVRKTTPDNSSAAGGDNAPQTTAPSAKGRAIGLGFSDPLVTPFVLCLVAGVVLVGFERVKGFENIALFGPVLATGAYPVWGWLSGIQSRPSLRERLADNSYYLGFIFTQVSLLVGFGGPALTGAAITSNDVLRFFGIAIGSSMIGLIARTLIVQTGHTVSESEDIIHDEVEGLAQEVSLLASGVSKTTAKVLRDLNDLSGKFEESRKVVAREIVEWTSSITEALRGYDAAVKEQVRITGASNQQVGEATRELKANVGKETEALGESIRSAASAIHLLRQNIDTKLVEAGDQIVANTRSIVEATDAVRSIQGNATTAVTQVTQNIRDTAKLLGQGTEAMRALDLLGSKIGALDHKIDGAVGAGEAIVSDASANAKLLKADLEDSTATLIAALKEFREELEGVRA